MKQQGHGPQHAGPGLWQKLIVLVALVAVVIVAYTRFGDRLVKFNEALEREGPFFPFFHCSCAGQCNCSSGHVHTPETTRSGIRQQHEIEPQEKDRHVSHNGSREESDD